MAKLLGKIRALAVTEAWSSIDRFANRTQLIDHLVGSGLGFRRTDMFKIIGNIWERSHAPILKGEKFRFDRVPKDLMAELSWQRDERFGVYGTALYRDEFGNLERHDTVFWTDNYSDGLEYEEEWAEALDRDERYPSLEYEGFEIKQMWHKKGADYGHPMLQEI